MAKGKGYGMKKGGKKGLPTGSGQSGTGKAPSFSHGGNANVSGSPAKKFC